MPMPVMRPTDGTLRDEVEALKEYIELLKREFLFRLSNKENSERRE